MQAQNGHDAHIDLESICDSILSNSAGGYFSSLLSGDDDEDDDIDGIDDDCHSYSHGPIHLDMGGLNVNFDKFNIIRTGRTGARTGRTRNDNDNGNGNDDNDGGAETDTDADTDTNESLTNVRRRIEGNVNHVGNELDIVLELGLGLGLDDESFLNTGTTVSSAERSDLESTRSCAKCIQQQS